MSPKNPSQKDSSASPSSSSKPNQTALFLDRIEGDVAVLILGESQEVKLPKSLLPSGAQEGEVLQLSLVRDPEATKKAQERVDKKRADLTKGDTGGDIKL
jgi:hypothetical protein